MQMSGVDSAEITAEILENKGFTYQQFPDGWYWFIEPATTSQTAKAIAALLGHKEPDTEELSDGEIILQCSSNLKDWFFVFGADVGTLDKSAIQIQEFLIGLPSTGPKFTYTRTGKDTFERFDSKTKMRVIVTTNHSADNDEVDKLIIDTLSKSYIKKQIEGNERGAT